MMENKYELVAWTKNVKDSEAVRLFVNDLDLQLMLLEPFFEELSECRREQRENGGMMSAGLARRFAKVYEDSARLDVSMGNIDYAIRFYLVAADFCEQIPEDFLHYCEQALSLARTYRFEHVLNEPKPKKTLQLYFQISCNASR